MKWISECEGQNVQVYLLSWEKWHLNNGHHDSCVDGETCNPTKCTMLMIPLSLQSSSAGGSLSLISRDCIEGHTEIGRGECPN